MEKENLDQRLVQWRQELEATLAFSTDEIDELEDHLRFSIAAKIDKGATLEDAWISSQADLGPASALASEFAKQKLMPALGRLLLAWWRPACLFLLFNFVFGYSYSMSPDWTAGDGTGHTPPVYRNVTEIFWLLTWVSFLLTLVLLPTRAQKNAALAGVGGAFCLIPLLYVLCYNPLTEQMIGPGWEGMGMQFGWGHILLSIVGLISLTLWWQIRSASLPNRSAMLAVAGMLVLLFALAPFVGELVGNFSIRDIFYMPTPLEVTYTGEVRSDFLKWKFVDVLVRSCIYITNFLPYALGLTAALGLCLLQACLTREERGRPPYEEVFPSTSSIPWMLLFWGSGLAWLAGSVVEPGFSDKMVEAEQSVYHAPFGWNTSGIFVLFAAALFFISSYELTRKLFHATRLRLFYSLVPVIFELGVVANSIGYDARSSEPLWLTWILWLGVLALAFSQLWLILKKFRNSPREISLWKCDGPQLVELGLLLGLVYAGASLVLTMVAFVMAFESTYVIYAMINWGSWVKDPTHYHFNPFDHSPVKGLLGHLAYWGLAQFTFLSLCLAAGLFTVIIFSGLEFIRFNVFRLYKVRKIRKTLTENTSLTPQPE